MEEKLKRKRGKEKKGSCGGGGFFFRAEDVRGGDIQTRAERREVSLKRKKIWRAEQRNGD